MKGKHKVKCPSCSNVEIPVILGKLTDEGFTIKLEPCLHCEYKPNMNDTTDLINKFVNRKDGR